MNIEEIYRLFIEAGSVVSTDTRKIQAGSLFFALKGDNFNGNQFAIQALEKGAKYAVVDEIVQEHTQLILVENVLHTLQHLAKIHRLNAKAKVIGIAGSNGKTTTKELLQSVLSQQFGTHYTKGNLNNHIGVPLTLLELNETHEVSIVELGTNREGDIRELCEFTLPDMGIITNIGKEHLQGFGSIEGVAKAESELFDDLNKRMAIAFVNQDDIWLKNMGLKLKHTIPYSVDSSVFELKALSPDIVFVYKGIEITSVLMGKHNFQNIVAVISIAEYFGLDIQQIKRGIELYQPSNNRSQIVKSARGNTILLDAYNANPSSVEAAISVLENMPSPRIAIIGDMFELGSFEAEEHQNIRNILEGSVIEQSILVGQAFGRTTGGEKSKVFENKEKAFESLSKLSLNASSILVKGSRGMKMEDFMELI